MVRSFFMWSSTIMEEAWLAILRLGVEAACCIFSLNLSFNNYTTDKAAKFKQNTLKSNVQTNDLSRGHLELLVHACLQVLIQ